MRILKCAFEGGEWCSIDGGCGYNWAKSMACERRKKKLI